MSGTKPAHYYHFVADTLRDKSPIPANGVWISAKGDLELCVNGMHASAHVSDALQYAPGPTLCLVELRGKILAADDKVCARSRRIVARFDATELLRADARASAQSVLKYWQESVPQIVLDWLTTGDEQYRLAAWYAAQSAAESAARSAAESAARSAAWYAAEYAAQSAAWYAAESAARSAAWYAAQSAAESAARSAAESAAESAARYAAESAAWSATQSAAQSAAWYAAESAARSASQSAARSAAQSAAWYAAESAARSAARDRLQKAVDAKFAELLK